MSFSHQPREKTRPLWTHLLCTRDAQRLLHEFGILDDEFNRRRQEKRYVVQRSEVPWELSVNGQAVSVVAPELGFNIHTLQVSDPVGSASVSG